MALTDPRSVIREILSRRPDLHAAFAPQLQAMGVQVAGPGFSGETRRRLDAANALQTGQVSDTTLGPVPTNMGSWPPRPTLEAGNMEFGRERERALMRSPFGDQGPPELRQSAPLPGSMDYGREQQRALMRSPMGDQGPLDPGNALPPELAARGPMPPSFGAGPGSEAARLPQFRPSFAPGTAEASLPPSPPQARPPEMGPPMPTSFAGNMPQPRPGLSTDPSLARDTSGLPPQVAALMGPQSPLAPSSPPNSTFSPYGPNASLARMPQSRPPQMPQARPPQGMSITGEPPEAPLSPDQRISNAPGAGPAPPIDPSIAAHAQRAALGARPAPTQGGFQPAPGFDQALRPNQPPVPPAPQQPPSAVAGFDPAATPFARPTGLNLAGPGMPGRPFNPNSAEAQATRNRVLNAMPSRTAQQPLIRQDLQNPIPPAGTAPLGAVTGQDLPAPGAPPAPLSFTPESVRNNPHLRSQALYNQPPPGMVLPPGVTQQDVGRLGFGATNIDPSKAPVHRYGSNTGKYAGAALGALKGLAGGPVGAGVGAALGYQGGKRVGGLLADRDFGLGARFTNPNYAQGVVANPPAIMDMGVPPITPPAQTPILQAGTGGIFGQGKSMLGGAAQKILSAVRSGAMPIEAAAKALGMDTGSLRDSLSSMGSAGRGGMGGMGGGGYGGGGYSGGNYGGYGGSRINEGIGQRFGNR